MSSSPVLFHSRRAALALALLDWLQERGVPAEELDALIAALQVVRKFVQAQPAKRRGKRHAGAGASAAVVTTGRRPRNAGRGSPTALSKSDPLLPPPPVNVDERFDYEWRRTSAEEQRPLIEWIAIRLELRGPQSVRELAIAKCASEREIKRAIAVAGGRFAWNEENDTYRLAG